ncbi:hypothetical protein F4776DRAFT_652184 [Hypoxylon sp. NC0597]|nr:hypothetical protein F4776DRAFT_652184 [Hypoxylon sp. NC0597]
MADGQIVWIIKRGDDVGELEPRTFPYEKRFSAQAGAHPARGYIEWTVDIWESERPDPPNRMAILEGDEDFMIAKSITMRTPVPVEQLPKVKKEGRYWYLLAYDLKIEISGACISLSAKWAQDKSVELIRTGLGVTLD